MRRAGHAALLLAVAACSRRAPLTSCDDDLRGVYRNGDERWMILDKSATLEAYPLFPDADGPAELVTAPRKIVLTRSPAGAPSATASPASRTTDAVASRATDAATASRATDAVAASPATDTVAASRATDAAPASHATDAAPASRMPDAVAAGRAINPGTLSGILHRRYMRGAASCDARIAVHVTRCAGDTLDLVVADPSPPIGFAPCAWPGPAPSRLVHWQRE